MRRSFVRQSYGPVLCLLVASLCAGCGDGIIDDPILRLSSEEAFAEGKVLLEAKKYELAREHFSHAFQTAPNSEVGREALLLQADSYFLAGGETNFIRAEAKYRDFNNRYPTSDRGAYVQYRIARSLEDRRRKPDRDQSETIKAIGAYEELLALYATSEYAAEAETGISRLQVSLAEHEYLVARYQRRRGLLPAAANRLASLVEDYPEYSELDKALCALALAYHGMRRNDSADETIARLRQEYPDSEHCQKMPKPLKPLSKKDRR